MQYGNAGGPGPNETRNLIIAGVLSIGILVGFNLLYAAPQQARLQAERARIEATQHANAGGGTATRPAADGEAAAPAAPATRQEALTASAAARVAIDNPALDGSISLQGARFDDLSLRQYRRTIAADSGEVSLLQPINSQHGYDAFMGWENRDTHGFGIGADDMWTAPAGARLTPTTPVTLTIRSQDGFEVQRVLSIDANYMITAVDTVHNTGATPISIRPFGVVRRQGLPEDYVNRGIVQQGFAGAFGPNRHLHTQTYQDGQKHARERDEGKIPEDRRLVEDAGEGGWMGLSDHYWLTALIVDRSEHMSGYYDSRTGDDGAVDYRAAYRGQWRAIPAGGTITYTQRVFSGAKRVDLLRAYQHDLNIDRFDEAVDWGNITWILTRTFFLWLLHPLATWVGSLHIAGLPAFGIAILLSTVVIKALMFPLVYQSFRSMARVRALQPKMKDLQERYAADKQRQQQEMIKLYQTEKVNPVSGCIPQLLTIPVFFALYKTLSVTIEMRHAPFFGWVHDLSAPDPSTIFNLFGLLPFDPHTLPVIGGFLAVGVWPILYGISMLALQGLSPPPTDATQAQVFRLMPIIFTFLFAQFPAGLVIYWTWSNTVTILQQYIITRRQGTETQFDTFIHRMREKWRNRNKPADEAKSESIVRD